MHLFSELTGYSFAESCPQTTEIDAVWPGSRQIIVKCTVD